MKWKFWKKDTAEALETETGVESARNLGVETAKPIQESYNKLPEEEPSGAIGQPTYEPPKPSLPQFSQNTDLQLISSKLDTIKAMLDILNQRLTAIEKHVEEKTKQKLW